MTELHWTEIFDNSVDGVAEVLSNGKLGYLNPTFRQFFDALGKDLRGTDWTELFHSDDRKALEEVFELAKSEGGAHLEEVRPMAVMGEVRLTVHLTQVDLSHTENPSWCLVVRPRGDGHRILGDGRGSLAERAGTQKIAVVLLDPLGLILEVDDGLEATFGEQTGSWVGRPWTELFRVIASWEKPDQEQPGRILEDLVGSGVAPAIAIHSEGAEFSARIRVSRSEVHQGFVLLVQDVTPVRGLQSALNLSELQTQVALRELRLLENAFDQHSIVAITDQAGRIIYANDKFCELSQYSREELLGQDHRIVNSKLHPKEFFRDLWRSISRGVTWRGEIRNRAKSGTYYWVDTTIVPIDSNGERRYVSIRTDVTERKRMQEQLVQAAKMAAIGELAGHIAHEVNNPIGIISAKARLMLSDLPEGLPPTIERDLGKIINQCDRLSRLTRGLLDFARPSVGARKPIRVQDALRRVVDLVQDRVKGRGAACDIRLARELPLVKGNPGELEQVFLNLILNSVDAIEPGGRVAISTSADARLSDGRPAVSIRVEDDGIGMSEEVRSRVFEPFFTTKEPGKGTGLGLSICQGLIRSHEGEVFVESQPEEGTSFEVRLPIFERQEEETAES
ncbi:MAG: PAS domain S-box protein [Planctomycetota bacterium]